MTNDTEAPTSEATKEALKDQLTGGGVLSPDDLEFITIACQVHGETGKVLSVEQAVKDWHYTEAEYEAFMSNQKVVDALTERGVIESEHKVLINPNPPVGKSQVSDAKLERLKKALTPKQLLVANIMLDITDSRSDKKKLQDLGVATSTYQAWLNTKVFSDYLRQRAELLIGNSQHEALLSLLDKVKAGDTKAIQLYLEFTGRFTSNVGGTTVNVGVQGTKSDFEAVLITILEIIQDEVHDYDTAVRISERFKAMINNKSVASQLLGHDEEIVIPEVRKSRTMTPELNQLTKGAGYE